MDPFLHVPKQGVVLRWLLLLHVMKSSAASIVCSSTSECLTPSFSTLLSHPTLLQTIFSPKLFSLSSPFLNYSLSRTRQTIFSLLLPPSRTPQTIISPSSVLPRANTKRNRTPFRYFSCCEQTIFSARCRLPVCSSGEGRWGWGRAARVTNPPPLFFWGGGGDRWSNSTGIGLRRGCVTQGWGWGGRDGGHKVWRFAHVWREGHVMV